MNMQPGEPTASTNILPVPTASAPTLCATWPRSVQFALGLLLATVLFILAGKSLFQSLQAGSSTIPSQRIDLNWATHAELRLLPGVGEQLALRIAKVRVEQGSFQKIEDLRKVSGIGPATLARLRDWVVISADPPAPISTEPALPLTVEPSKRAGAKPKKGTNLTELIDINTAGGAQLMEIPGIGPKLSQRIIEQRAQKPFQTVADLRRVPGIGPKILEKIRPFVTVKKEERSED